MAFFHHLIAKGILPRSTQYYALKTYLRYRMGRLSLKQVHTEVFERFLKGHYFGELKAHVETFLDLFLDKALSFELISIMNRAQHLGHVTALISTSPLFLALPIGKRLGIDHTYGTRYGIDVEGRMTHIEEVVDGRRKAVYAKQLAEDLNLGKDSIWAYSDSYEDIRLLRAVGNPVAVGPDRRLKLLALRRNIPIRTKSQ